MLPGYYFPHSTSSITAGSTSESNATDIVSITFGVLSDLHSIGYTDRAVDKSILEISKTL